MKPFRLLKGRLARLPLPSLSTLSIINAAAETSFIRRCDNSDARGIFYLVTAGRLGMFTSSSFLERHLFSSFFLYSLLLEGELNRWD